jgi:hypothetical protein
MKSTKNSGKKHSLTNITPLLLLRRATLLTALILMPVLEMREVAASVNDYSNEFGSLEETSLYPEYFVWIKNR